MMYVTFEVKITGSVEKDQYLEVYEYIEKYRRIIKYTLEQHNQFKNLIVETKILEYDFSKDLFGTNCTPEEL